MRWSSLYLPVFWCRLLLVVKCSNVLMKVTNSSSSMQPLTLCSDEESSALLQFKHSFSIDEFASARNPPGHSKFESWKLDGENSDCCTWDGVECDEDTGHVIGLNLSRSSLYGSINSSSSLFNLVHLQRLNLGGNNFNQSEIPSAISKLSSLTSLDLLSSYFSGQVPSEVLGLSKLTSLVLSFNPLKLHNPGLNSLVENLTSLQMLHLSTVDISSAVPDAMANLSSLTSLILRDCGLHGHFPVDIFHLKKLQVLIMDSNQNLTGYIPEFNQSIPPLQQLRLALTNFSGELPYSIGNLKLLNVLDLGECGFSGSLPASIGNLTELVKLSLDSNQFVGEIPYMGSLSQVFSLSLNYNKFNRGTLPWLGKLAKIIVLHLSEINLYGSIPSSLANLTQLANLVLNSNHLTGQIPSQLMNQTQLLVLDLSYNQLQGPIPSSFSDLKNLGVLDLSGNSLSGTVELGNILKLKNLSQLSLSDNNLTVLSLLTKNTINATLPKFKLLNLRSCNLREFPDFLRFQDELELLSLAQNEIHGQLPEWMGNASEKILPWANLSILDLSFNMLEGPVPIPPLSIFSYQISNNRLTGKIPTQICNATSLYWLDLSNNELSGRIPLCLHNLSKSLSVLNFKGNTLEGTIPQICEGGSMMRMIDLSQNQLQGKMPRSLANCSTLEILNLGNNQIEDTFPIWLGALPVLQVLILRSNKFDGAIGSPKSNLEFSQLRIIDLSYNSFTGDLPLGYFHIWQAMKMVDEGRLTYMQANMSYQVQRRRWNDSYEYSLTIINKGIKTEYYKIQTLFKAIDLSSNKFEGEIPGTIGYLCGAQLLNLSNNALIGSIPSSLGNLTSLESLDLSQNKLSGEIPLQLTQLNFLAFLDVSHNHLTGPIPHGKQFDTFENNSYEGNPGLCGNPLSKKCGDPLPPSFSEQDDEDSDQFLTATDWIIIYMGFGCGLLVGLFIGHILTSRINECFVKTFGRRH
ncbi:Receptor-like protein [Actinidia chinensis var. chinensis]|uniref:Receptor-like protein n=1 Tax=Actinidia chinensis var. chinensis TaxID=1590841 RepID=A0A2R6QWG0_ACTCC|nr:Receptor-like protein [Actinidia chinensis var. chinensis]